MKKEEFEQTLQNEPNVLILDIREAEEVWKDSSIPNTKHMPMGKVFTEAVKDNLPKDKRIIVFCRTGVRAGIVARELSSRGYDIEGLEGGLEALKSE